MTTSGWLEVAMKCPLCRNGELGPATGQTAGQAAATGSAERGPNPGMAGCQCQPFQSCSPS